MLRFLNAHPNSAHQSSRREWLRIGGLAGLNWALPGLIPKRASADSSNNSTAPGFGKAKSVIVVFASGGQSQIDMWDPKPDAPKEIRGAFSSINTAIPGVRFSEHMPQIAKVADKLCIVRSMAHEDLDHGSAFYLSMTGRYHRRRSGNPLPSPEDMPCHGAVLHRVRPNSAFAQTAIHLNGPAEVPLIIAPGQFGGFLGRGYDPLTLGDVTKDEIAVPSLLPHLDVPSIRMQSRQSLLHAVENNMRVMEHQKLGLDKSALYEQAFNMLRRGGTANIIGMIPLGQNITLPGAAFLGEKRIQGSLMGSNRFPVDMPRLVDFYMSGKLKLDEMISQRIRLDQVNEGFDDMKKGGLARSVIVFD